MPNKAVDIASTASPWVAGKVAGSTWSRSAGRVSSEGHHPDVRLRVVFHRLSVTAVDDQAAATSGQPVGYGAPNGDWPNDSDIQTRDVSASMPESSGPTPSTRIVATMLSKGREVFDPTDARNAADANSRRSTGAIAVSRARYSDARSCTSASEGLSDTKRRASFSAIRWAVAGWWAR